MADVTYEEDKDESILYARIERASQVPQMEQWILSHGVASDSRRAKYLLLAISVVALLLAGIIPLILLPHSQKTLSDHDKQMLDAMSRDAHSTP